MTHNYNYSIRCMIPVHYDAENESQFIFTNKFVLKIRFNLVMILAKSPS